MSLHGRTEDQLVEQFASSAIDAEAGNCGHAGQAVGCL